MITLKLRLTIDLPIDIKLNLAKQQSMKRLRFSKKQVQALPTAANTQKQIQCCHLELKI